MKQERLQLNHRPDSFAGELGGEIEVVVRMKREQRIFQELYINRQSPLSKRVEPAHSQLGEASAAGLASGTKGPQGVTHSVSIRNSSTSESSPDLFAPVIVPQMEAYRLFPGIGLRPQLLNLAVSGM